MFVEGLHCILWSWEFDSGPLEVYCLADNHVLVYTF